jgi:membrane-associated protease RseP (regulator of RpoE activity)
MNRVSWFLRISGLATLTLVMVIASFASNVASNTLAATEAATVAATPVIKITDICVADPTPTPEPATAGPSPTEPPATPVVTEAPTVVPTKAPPTAKPPPTVVPTKVPVGKLPAWAGITVNRSKLKRGGKGCINVLSVVAKGPAAVAGLKTGDLILGVDKLVVRELPDLYNAIAAKKSGEKISVTYQRDGKYAVTALTLGLNPNSVVETPAK